jgi:hypothetical protein
MHMNRALISLVLGVALAPLGFSQQNPPPTPPQYPQGPPEAQAPRQQPYPQQPQYPEYPQGQPQYPQGQPQYPQGQPQYPPSQAGYPQQPYPGVNQPPLLPPQQLDQMVASIALYPDGLLAHVLSAATFPQQIPEAAGWANQHAYLHGEALAEAIRQDNLPWDVSVLALLPFPQVLSQMAQYMQWTQQLGDAVLAQRGDVMDAVQRLRARANQEGYLRDPQFTQYERVEVEGPIIQIDPIGPAYYVPYYNPQIFFVGRRPGFYAGFSFGPAVPIGGFFGGFGWGVGFGFGWREHAILVGGNPWNRGWVDRGRVVVRPGFEPNRRVEQHGWAPERRGGEERREHR